MDLIIFWLVRYTVLDPGDVPPVAITTAETSATTITPTTAGSSASSVALGTKKSNSVSIPMVVGIAAAIGVLAIAILFFLYYRMRRAAYVNEEAEPRIYSPETPPGFQPSKLTQQSAPVPIVNAVPEPAGQHFRRNRGNPPLPVRELIDYEPAWLSGSVSELSPQTGNNQTSFGTTEAGFGAHRQTFATPTAHSLASGNATNNVAAEPWTMPRTVVFTHNNGIEVAEKQPRMGEMGINGSRAEQPDHRIYQDCSRRSSRLRIPKLQPHISKSRRKPRGTRETRTRFRKSSIWNSSPSFRLYSNSSCGSWTLAFYFTAASSESCKSPTP